ncbi:TIGR03943 family putative permease subunit [Micromonospora carbonacea]|uniref:TIGR03943 family protein n=1 Tax=Micromonospora carbonacea TaxID=47853 RepID=A0A7H8XSX5_9ACTN|nr:TIGR03943 family protein [Micromonospora carbonacea]MBB5824883.1 putative repeat protein (TIGR03943 family) [Micromonospora carbonacea]QLD26982.1 TIGR03943 family protein [Micromonospora carbonacea]
MNRQAQAVVLLLLGGAVVRASVTDLYLRYVKEGLRPFLIAAGLVLVAAAVMTLWYDLRPAPRGDAHPADDDGPGAGPGGHPADDDGHGHGHHGPRVGWLLLLPVLGLLLVAPPALGSYAVGRSGTALAGQQQSDYPPLPPGDPAPVTVLDYASRALFERGASIGERRVRLTGFVAPGPDGQPILARMVLSCCAADGRPVKLGMTGDVPQGLPPDTWVEVTGRYSDRVGRDPVNDAEIPYLAVESWREVPAPRNQYE